MSTVQFFIRALPFFFLILFGIALLVLAHHYGSIIGFPKQFTTALGVYLLASLLLPGVYRFMRVLIDWYYDESIITNQRIIIHDQQGIFAEGVVTASMRSVEEVTLLQKGFLRTIFDFRSLEV